MYLTISQNRW